MARAQNYPTRSVLLLVGYAPGGPTDICARLISQWLSKRLGQQFVVENRSGAGSNIATEAAIHADPDGYTLLLVTSSNAINATLYQHLNFNFMRDMVPIAGIMQAPSVLEVNPSVPVKSAPSSSPMPRPIRARSTWARPATAARRTCSPNCSCTMAGVKLTVVGYRGGGPALVDLLGGQVQVMFEGITSSIGYIRAGKLRPLGGHFGETLGGAAGHPGDRRVRAGLRRHRLVRPRRAQGDAAADHRPAGQGGRRSLGRSDDEGAVRRSGRRADADGARANSANSSPTKPKNGPR